MNGPTEFDLTLPDLPLTLGGVVRQHRARVWVWEPVAPAAARTVLLVHALTGSARAGGEGGWWEPLIGPGKPLDPTRDRLICINNLGGCSGSSGPDTAGWPSGAVLTTDDQARAQWLALEALGHAHLDLAAGGSLGGMVLLAMAAQRPEAIARLMPLGACASTSAWVLGFNHVQRQCIALDPVRGLEVARQVAMLTYRAEPGLEGVQSRRLAPKPGALGEFRVQGYLEHQGVLLRQRFTMPSYLALLDAMDHHDVASRLPLVRAPALVVDLDTDVLFTPAQSDLLGRLLPHAQRATISTQHGHDAFLIEWEALAPLVTRALNLSVAAPAVATSTWREAGRA